MTLQSLRPGASALASLVLAACGPAAGAGAPIAPTSGAAMCAALTAADLAGVGIRNASAPKANVPEAASAYCVYAGQSSATGGIELDVFYPSGATAAEARESLADALAEFGAQVAPIAVAGADEARWAPNAVSGGPAFAVIGVRRSNLVFILGIPASPAAQSQLLTLARAILGRF